MNRFLKKKKSDDSKVGKAGFSHGLLKKREDQLNSRLLWSLGCNILLIIMASLFATAAILKPDRVLVVEKDTGRIVGEYRTTAFRTNSELLAGTKKFAENFLSMNSRTIYMDCAVALNMMSKELQDKRKKYLERTNLLRTIEIANTRSQLVIKENKIMSIKGIFAKCEISGDIIIDQNRAYATKKKEIDEEDVKLERNSIPFRLLADMQMVPISELNTSGVKVVDYYEFD